MEEGSSSSSEQCLLERILDGKEKPADLSLALLQKITNDFSKERKIGQGGFGAVYKGVFRKRIVAVKKIEKIDIDDKLFDREFNCLWVINHENVVRFLGFCSNTCKKPVEKAGITIFAEVRERLFCFEYISGGSLDKHITDELRGLEWETRYEIIIGICKGLCYLHEKAEIIHMDLKPVNILLDGKHMVPKITDFGLSRPNTNSHTMAQPIGTLGYIAPEYSKNSKTTPACDIYSLGAIIMELVTGGMEVPNKHNVLRRWRHRWNKPPTPLQYRQVIRCIEIAGRCREQKPEDRPSIEKIIDLLSGSTDGQTDQEISTYMDDDMLGIEPLELHIHKEMSWSVKITNKTKACFAFEIERPSKQYTIWPDQGVVPSGCKDCIVHITAGAPQLTQNADKFIVRSTKVSEGLTVEHITKHIFNEEAGKVVDEVDLMVVIEPAKPNQNFRSREDINMSDDEVHEPKKRKIVESASRKGKNKHCRSENAEATSMQGISSSGRGQCAEQTKQCKLYPPRSFSRNYTTNTTYLGEESHRAVDVARGAMGSLLDKLGKLVTGDYSLDPKNKGDIESFSEDLAKIHLDLPKLQNVVRAKIFVDEVRELSYNIEDMIDSLLVHVEPNSSRSGFREIMHETIKLVQNGMTTHHQIGDVIRDIKANIKEVAKRKEKYNIDANDVVTNATTKATIGLRISAIYEHEERIVGIKTPRDALIRLLQEDGDASKQELKIISIVGMGGLGKTTLAKAVYEELKGYHPKAFVSVGQNPNVETVLKKIIRKFQQDFETKNLDVDDLIEKLQELLKDKRYFIVIDDLWDSSAWGVIHSAFRGNKCGSRMITTTRTLSIALACCNSESKYVHRIKPLSDEDSKELFLRRIFGSRKDCIVTPRKEEISKYILDRCSGMPLAINSIASLLAGGKDSTWEYVLKTLGALSEGNGFENMKEILDLSYIHLPDHLKTCLLYVCMYLEGREIDKNELLRKWVAEGFVHVRRNSVFDAVDVAERYLEELINMCMIQPEKIDYNNEVLSCRVHDIILDLMRSKSGQVNFIQVIDGLKDVSGPRGEIHRVSVQYNDKEDGRILETIKVSLSHARSVLLYRASLIHVFLEYKYVRVLHIEDDAYRKGLDLTGISSLLLLRYLKIACFKLSDGELKLPVQIGQLQQLETIDLQGCELKNYPSDIVTLPRLSHLRCGSFWGTMLPYGIERLKSLHTLEGVCVGQSTVDTIKGLGELTNLRNLGIITYRLEEEASARMNALHSSISRLSTSLRILTLEGGLPDGHDLSSWSRPLFPQGSAIQKLNLSDWSFERCPEWIGQLHNLYSLSITVREVADGVSIVGGLPSLAYFCLCVDKIKEKEESVVIPGAFQALKHLILISQKTSLTFEAGAMPKLEKLDIPFPYNIIRRKCSHVLSSIEHLPAPSLKYISLTVTDMLTDWTVKGSEHWNYHYWYIYWGSDHYADKIKKRAKKTVTLLKRAFKLHHPSADICIKLADNIYLDSEDVDEENYEEDGDEEQGENAYDDEDYYNDEAVHDEEAQVHASTRKLVQLIEAQEDSSMMGIETAARPMVDTSLHLAVGSEGRQGGRSSQDSESLHLPSTSLVAHSPSFRHVTLALCSSPDTAGNEGVDLNQAPNDLNDEEDEDGAYQVNGSQALAQVQANTRQFELSGTQEDSSMVSVNTDGHPMVDMSLRLVVGSEGSLQPHYTSVLVNEVGQHLDLNQAIPGGLLHLNQASNEFNDDEYF